MTCKLCVNSNDFGKSHIIPEAFYRQFKVEDESPLSLSNKPDYFPKKSRIGEYDNKILCKACEKKFDVWDDYGIKFFLQSNDHFESIVENNREVGLLLSTFDYQKLKLFIISVLWRASISKRTFFQRINLGLHEEKLRKHILCNKAPEPDDYAMQLFRYTGFKHGIPILMPMNIKSPYRFNYIRIYFGAFFADVNVDSRRTPEKYNKGIVSPGVAIVIPNQTLSESKEYPIFKKIVNAKHNRNAI